MTPYGYILCCMINDIEHYYTFLDNWRKENLIDQAIVYSPMQIETQVKAHNEYYKYKNSSLKVYSKPVYLSLNG